MGEFKEALAIIGKGGILSVHVPRASQVEIPDSRGVWEAIWRCRKRIVGVAHSHPCSGWPSPSQEDLTTFAAIEDGLGKRLRWWIISETHWAAFVWRGPGRLQYEFEEGGLDELPRPAWFRTLHRISGYR